MQLANELPVVIQSGKGGALLLGCRSLLWLIKTLANDFKAWSHPVQSLLSSAHQVLIENYYIKSKMNLRLI